MKITDHIAQHLTDVHRGDNWTDVNIENTLKDVSLQEAITVTKASANTIAALLYHINFYTEVVHERFKGNNPFINEANGFDMPVLNTENDWINLQNKNYQSAQDLAEAVKQCPEEKLSGPVVPGSSSVYKTLHGLIEHTHYHLGQIVILKTLVKLKPANS